MDFVPCTEDLLTGITFKYLPSPQRHGKRSPARLDQG